MIDGVLETQYLFNLAMDQIGGPAICLLTSGVLGRPSGLAARAGLDSTVFAECQ